jgi:hypothetical protein
MVTKRSQIKIGRRNTQAQGKRFKAQGVEQGAAKESGVHGVRQLIVRPFIIFQPFTISDISWPIASGKPFPLISEEILKY